VVLNDKLGYTQGQVLFKENVRYQVWIYRDPVSLIAETRFFLDFRDPMIIFWDSKALNRVPKTP